MAQNANAGAPSVVEEVPYDPSEAEQYYPGDDASTANAHARTYKAEDGTTYYWNAAQHMWLPQIDDSLLEQQQAAYGGPTQTQPSTQPSTKSAPSESQQEPNSNNNNTENANKPKKRKKPNKPKAPTGTPQVNPNDLYVEGLPIDVTIEEAAEFFSKTGIIRKDPVSGELMIKLYKDAEGRVKGDATVCYFKKESVDLALSILDGSDFRKDCPIKLSVAQYVNKPGAKKKNKRSKKIRTIDQKQELTWEESENVNVIIKHMFEPQEAWDDPKFFDDLKEDLTVECNKFGPVAKIVIFEHNPEGVIAVKFKDPDSAVRCIEKMNGRFFASKKLEAGPYDGRTNYHVDESEQSKQQRMARWEKWLEDDDSSSAAAPSAATNS